MSSTEQQVEPRIYTIKYYPRNGKRGRKANPVSEDIIEQIKEDRKNKITINKIREKYNLTEYRYKKYVRPALKNI